MFSSLSFRQLATFTFGSISLLLLSACGASLEQRAQSYHDMIVSHADPAYTAYNDYTVFSQETSLKDLSLIDQKRLNTMTLIQETLDQIETLETFEGDSLLQEAVVNDLSTLFTLLKDDEVALIELRERMREADPNLTTPEAMDLLQVQQQTIFGQINEKITESDRVLSLKQQQFREIYGFGTGEIAVE